MSIFNSSDLNLLFLIPSPISFNVLSGCVDNHVSLKYSTELLAARAVDNVTIPLSVTDVSPVSNLFIVLFVLSNTSYAVVSNLVTIEIES